MISIKNRQAQELMATAGAYLAELFVELDRVIQAGVSTHDIDQYVDKYLSKRQLVSQTRGFGTYRHVSCVSVNDELVHGVPRAETIVPDCAVVKVDVCAAWKGYCADMARCYTVGQVPTDIKRLINTAQEALDAGIGQAHIGKRIRDIAGAIQDVVEREKFGIIRDFAGHGIGKRMHEEPEILNFRSSGQGQVLRAGMAFALEPMISQGNHAVTVDADGWTVRTRDKSWTAHVEDTVIVTDAGPRVITRLS